MLRALLAFLLVFSGAVAADPVRVQTGEHETFTRVVLTIPDGADWALNRDAQGYVVNLPATEGYDLDRFFELIPADRIQAVSQDRFAGELYLAVECACYADAFLDPPNILVIDIHDGAPATDSPFEVARAVSPVGLSVVAQPQPVPQFTVKRNPLIPLVFEADTPLLRPIIEDESDRPVRVADGIVSGEITSTTDDQQTVEMDLTDLETSVVESLGRALSQGLLEPETDGTPADRQMRDFVAVATPGIRAVTGVDQAAIPENPQTIITQDGQLCLPGRFFDVATWGDERSYATQIAEARAKLTSATDQLDEEATRDLARKYVYFGFGREAEQTLQLDGVSSMERNYLIAMARIIDGDPFDRSPFAQQASCASQVALWAFLASGPDAVDVQVDQPAVLRTFMGLPEVLKQHLAPMLSDRFVAIGDNDAAVQIMKILRSTPDAPLAADLAQVDLLRSLGEEDAAIQQVVEIAETNVRATPKVIIARLNDAVQNELPLTADDFLLADSLRFENAQKPVASDIAVAQIRAYLYQKNFAAAESLLREQADRIIPETLTALENEYGRSATDSMEADAFLEFAFDPLSANLMSAIENAIAARLLTLGFPERARDVVSGDASPDNAIERSYLRAKAALALSDPTAVLAALEGRQSDQAKTLRAIALDIAQSNGIASEAYADEAPQSLWRRGDWSALAGSEDALLQAASNAALDNEIGALDPDKPLTSGRNLLELSMESREIMDALLTRFSVSEDG